MNASELPLPDYDSLPVGSIESRARTLDTAGVRALLDYENEHAGRLQVVQLLRHRLHSLERGDVRPSGGSPVARAPEVGGSPTPTVQASPQKQGPPVNPPSHGDPTNPAQPRI
jgi:hypothetical protein